jgi:hypothetical protein
VEALSEKLKRRIQLIEQKLSPPKPLFDIIAEVRQIKLERDRLLSLSPEEYEAEIRNPPSTQTEKVARTSAANQKHYLALSPQEKQAYLGYPTSHFTTDEFAKIQEDRDLIKKDPNNWVTAHLAKIHSSKP